MKNEWPKRRSDYAGASVETLRELTNGYVRVPAHTRMRVVGYASGLRLERSACPVCEVSILIMRVQLCDVKLLTRYEDGVWQT